MDTNKTIKNYIESLSSNSPTPGGGNVAAFCGALSSALGTMVCNLTIGKKKYVNVESDMINLAANLKTFTDDFLTLAKEDNEAFDKVMTAFKLPKETDIDKLERDKQIQDATVGAAIVPANVIKKCYELVPFLIEISDRGNTNSISDVGVALLLADTASKGAYLNVVINCSSLANQTIAYEIIKQNELFVNEISNQVELKYRAILSSIKKN
ncbi:MAG: cyclodeaminase/cyclohydrolase family protein [Melioribacteraceae bacterium]|nr:cyclodeaminase/cyclohydrolase family protein [Melioribacteraceae bacterium]